MGVTLRQLLEGGAVPQGAIRLVQRPLVDAIALSRSRGLAGALTCDAVAIDVDGGSVSFNPSGDVPVSEAADVAAYGQLLERVASHCAKPPRLMQEVARRCKGGEATSWHEVDLMLERHAGKVFYIALNVFIIVLLAVLWTINHFAAR